MTGVLRTRDEEGAALIIGLVVLMSFGLIIGSLMSLGGTSLIATSALRDQRAQIYAAEAAIDEEATRLRAGSACQDAFDAPLYSVPKANPVAVTVQCSPGPGGTFVLSAYLGSKPALQARFVIDLTKGTATVVSWDANHDRFNQPDPGPGGE